ncbi:MAG: cytochrome c [Terracidiphilus sp.]|nr:cytochrome c [Terracidiphilus sp.]MDR3799130.1 cytochrome c [Terracidiphilus sp.]
MKVSSKRFVILCLAAAFVTPAFAQSSGADIYKAKCLMCHGPDGMANNPAGKALKAVSFKDPAVIKASDAELFTAVKNGKGKMPAENGKLTDAQINAAIQYVRTLEK